MLHVPATGIVVDNGWYRCADLNQEAWTPHEARTEKELAGLVLFIVSDLSQNHGALT